MKRTKLLLAMTLVVVLAMVALVWFFPSNGDFQVENSFWNGFSSLDSELSVTPLSSLGSLPSAGSRTVLLLIPYTQFTDAEFAGLSAFVSSGGTLVVLDDYGYGNQVLSGLGLDLRFTSKPLLDPLFNYRNKWFPRISDFADTSMAVNVSTVVLNHASSLNGTFGATVVASSSSFSFLDLNGNDEWDDGEPLGPLPVVAYAGLGRGTVVAVADPSIVINGMIELDDNRQFIANVVGLERLSVQVFVDQSHLPTVPLDEAKAVVGVAYGVVSSFVGTLSLIAVVLALSLKSLWAKRVKS